MPPDADRAARIAALIDRANGADARFQTELAETRGSVGVASGAAVGSEAWVVAQQAISRADARRTAVSESLADLDRMQIDGPESQALDQALASVSALEQGERSALLALRDRLSAP